MERKYNLEERLISFAIDIIKLSEKLPHTYAGKHLAGNQPDVVQRQRSSMLKPQELKAVPTLFTK